MNTKSKFEKRNEGKILIIWFNQIEYSHRISYAYGVRANNKYIKNVENVETGSAVADVARKFWQLDEPHTNRLVPKSTANI